MKKKSKCQEARNNSAEHLSLPSATTTKITVSLPTMLIFRTNAALNTE